MIHIGLCGMCCSLWSKVTKLKANHNAFDHNPPHIHVRSGSGKFTITIKDRIVEGRASSRTIKLVNDFIDSHESEIMEVWDKAQKGEPITKIQR